MPGWVGRGCLVLRKETQIDDEGYIKSSSAAIVKVLYNR
jgi:hypothetical protein